MIQIEFHWVDNDLIKIKKNSTRNKLVFNKYHKNNSNIYNNKYVYNNKYDLSVQNVNEAILLSRTYYKLNNYGIKKSSYWVYQFRSIFNNLNDYLLFHNILFSFIRFGVNEYYNSYQCYMNLEDRSIHNRNIKGLSLGTKILELRLLKNNFYSEFNLIYLFNILNDKKYNISQDIEFNLQITYKRHLNIGIGKTLTHYIWDNNSFINVFCFSHNKIFDFISIGFIYSFKELSDKININNIIY